MIEWKQDKNGKYYNNCGKSCMECERIIWEKCEYSCECIDGEWDCENCKYHIEGKC